MMVSPVEEIKEIGSAFKCDPMDFFKNIKESLRYESELADRRLTYLMTLQTCVAGGSVHFLQKSACRDWVLPFVSVIGIAVSLVMFFILKKGMKATGNILSAWVSFRMRNGFGKTDFPPVWGVKGDVKRGALSRLFENILGVAPEYYVVLPLLMALAWIVLLFVGLYRCIAHCPHCLCCLDILTI